MGVLGSLVKQDRQGTLKSVQPQFRLPETSKVLRTLGREGQWAGLKLGSMQKKTPLEFPIVTVLYGIPFQNQDILLKRLNS
jgi:hypothetical protein